MSEAHRLHRPSLGSQRGALRRSQLSEAIVSHQNGMFRALWLPADNAEPASDVLKHLADYLEIELDRALPPCVEQDRPAATKSEKGLVENLFLRVASARRAVLTACDYAFTLDALGVALAGERDDEKALLMKGPDFDELAIIARHDDDWYDRPENRYWHPPRIGKPYDEGSDHLYATRLIRDGLFRARDRVLARARQSEDNRFFFDALLPRLQGQYVRLRNWKRKFSEAKGVDAAPMERVEESLAGVLTETSGFILHGINAWLDAALTDLPSRLSEDDINWLSNIGIIEFERTILRNCEALFLGPASLKVEEHAAMLDLVPGNANPIRPGLLGAELHRTPFSRNQTALRAFWKDQDLARKLKMALRFGSRCGGLSRFGNCDGRSAQIGYRVATDMYWSGVAGLNPIVAATMLARLHLHLLRPRIHKKAPWLRMDEWPTLQRSKQGFSAIDWPDLVRYEPPAHRYTYGFNPNFQLRRWHGDDFMERARSTGIYGEPRDWHPAWVRRAHASAEGMGTDAVQEALRREVAGPLGPFRPGVISYSVYREAWTGNVDPSARPVGEVMLEERPGAGRVVLNWSGDPYFSEGLPALRERFGYQASSLVESAGLELERR